MTETETAAATPAAKPLAETPAEQAKKAEQPAAPREPATAAETTPAETSAPAPTDPSALPELPGPMTLEHFDLGVTLGTGSFGRVRLATHKVRSPAGLQGGAIGNGDHLGDQDAQKGRGHQAAAGGTHDLGEDDPRRASASFHRSAGGDLPRREVSDSSAWGERRGEPKMRTFACFIIGGEFFTHLRKAGRFDSQKSRFYAAQVAVIFEYLHGQDIIYRDLKPENLLLDETGYIKITDFGFAKHVTFKTYTLCGTPEYIAPEVLLNKGHGKGVDWWTLGILIYEMMAGQPPFVDEDPMGIYQQVVSGRVAFPRFIDRKAKSLIKKLLVADLTKRYGCLKNGAADVKNHKWFSDFDFEALLERSLPAPIIPEVKSKTDTSNFDPYPEDDELVEVPSYSGKDPFENF
eukprot:scaffold2012_cov228-Pinguiococcus_pyrenoidosus.AAC.9